MARIVPATRDQIAANELTIYDEFMSSRAGRPFVGPYSLLLHTPDVAQKLEAFRLALRDEASLPGRLQELVMITVAREMDCAFIWYAHAAAARQAGVPGEAIDAIRERREPGGLDASEQSVLQFTRELLRNRKVNQLTFDEATSQLGERGVLALTTLISCYAVLAYVMDAYELEAPEHATEPALPMMG